MGEKLIKSKLIKAMAEAMCVPAYIAEAGYERFLQEIIASLCENKSLRIPKVATIRVVERERRRLYSVSEKQFIELPRRISMVASISPSLRKIVLKSISGNEAGNLE